MKRKPWAKVRASRMSGLTDAELALVQASVCLGLDHLLGQARADLIPEPQLATAAERIRIAGRLLTDIAEYIGEPHPSYEGFVNLAASIEAGTYAQPQPETRTMRVNTRNEARWS